MGTRREVLGYVVVVKPHRNGNGAIGGGRKNNSGKRCKLYKINGETNERELIAQADGSTAVDALRRLKESTRVIPIYVSISGHGETYF